MNLNENQSNQQEVEMFDIKQVLERYMRHWKWFALSIFTFLAMVFIYLKVTIPVYNTSAKLLVEDKKSGGGSGELAVFSDLGLFSNTSSLANEVEILKSRTLIERVVRSEEHTSELQSRPHLVCRLLLEKKKKIII